MEVATGFQPVTLSTREYARKVRFPTGHIQPAWRTTEKPVLIAIRMTGVFNHPHSLPVKNDQTQNPIPH